jgi:SAM-dependent methyltransferase
MGVRTTIQERLVDPVQFLIDRAARGDYQPLPWVGADRAARGSGSQERWRLLEPELDRLRPASAVDIGCNLGFFALSLAERGIPTVGIESERRFVRLAQHAARRAGIADLAVLEAHLRPETIWEVPAADLVLLLSVYHHWVRHYGAQAAETMLRQVWDRTGTALVFDTGETELPDHFNAADMGADVEAHLRRHLTDVCTGGQVRCLGTSRAFAPGRGDERTAPALRHLFLVERP